MYEVAPLNLVRLAVRIQWPAMVLSVTLVALSTARRLGWLPGRWARMDLSTGGPAILMSWPVYLWGCTAVVSLVQMFDNLAVSGLNSAAWPNRLWALAFGEFLALLAVIFPGTLAVLPRGPVGKARDFVGPIWAIAAIALDHLFVLVMVTPLPGGR